MTTACAPPEASPAELPDARTQIASLLFALLVVDPGFVVREVNPAAENLLGAGARRLCGQSLDQCLHIDDAALFDRLRVDNAPLIARGLAMQVADEMRRVNLTSSPLAGDVAWRVVTVSEAAQTDMAYASKTDASLKAPAVLAHEIKNPLAAIRGAAQLVARKLDKADRQLTDVMSAEVDRIARLVDRMQALGSATHPENGPVNLHGTIRKAMAVVRVGTAGTVTFEESFDPSLPDVAGNADQLEQVVINLLSNAVDACGNQNDPLVSVRTRFVSGLAATIPRAGSPVRLPIEIAIADNGAGVDAALEPHIFEPFVTSKRSGQGLGLPLVKKLVADMGGRVRHRRDAREGRTVFTVHLAIAGANEGSIQDG